MRGAIIIASVGWLFCTTAFSTAATAASKDTEELHAQLYQLENALNSSRERAERLSNKNQKLRQRIQELERALSVKSGKIDTLEARLTKAQERNGHQDLVQLRWRARLAETRATRQTHRVDTVRQRNKELRQQLKSVDQEVTSGLSSIFTGVAGALSSFNGISDEMAADVRMSIEAIENRQQPQDIRKACGRLSEAVAKIRNTPLGQPVLQGQYSSMFGQREHPTSGRTDFHTGVDIAADHGVAVRATAEGVVHRTVIDDGYGRMVEIEHPDGRVTRYAHLSEWTVREGEEINRGDKIGEIGSTGISTGPHLHYEVRTAQGEVINPLPYMEPQKPVVGKLADIKDVGDKLAKGASDPQ